MQQILKKMDIARMEGEEKTHFLNANAIRRNISLGDLTGLSGVGVHLIRVSPGRESTEYHRHLYEDECVYILEGEAEVTIGDTAHRLNSGDFVGYPAGGKAHAMTNVGNTDLVCLVIGERLAHDVSEYPRQGKKLYRNHGQPWDLVDIEAIASPR